MKRFPVEDEIRAKRRVAVKASLRLGRRSEILVALFLLSSGLFLVFAVLSFTCALAILPALDLFENEKDCAVAAHSWTLHQTDDGWWPACTQVWGRETLAVTDTLCLLLRVASLSFAERNCRNSVLPF